MNLFVRLKEALTARQRSRLHLKLVTNIDGTKRIEDEMASDITVEPVRLTNRNRSRISPGAIVSLIARMALECREDLPDDVLDNLVGRFRVEKGAN